MLIFLSGQSAPASESYNLINVTVEKTWDLMSYDFNLGLVCYLRLVT